MDPQSLRNPVDRAMAQALLKDPQIQQMSALVADAGGNTRRSLLAQALRLTPQIAPELHEVLDHCVQTLKVDTELEVYVYAAPQFNAGCTSPENGRVFLLLTASLLEAFDTPELTFVIGHELGHHIYEHHKIPLQAFQQGSGVAARTLLKGHAWLRQAELSADRAGLLCTGSLSGALRSFFKLSSGMRQAPGPEQVAAYMRQAEELYREDESLGRGASVMDWMSTHPFSPVRMRAAEAFSHSEVMRPQGTPMPEMEAQVQGLMGLMEASYLEEDSEGAEAMRRLLFAAGAVLGGSDGELSRVEVQALAGLLGHDRVPRTLDPERLKEVLPERIERVVALVAPPKRVQLIRDLCHIAQADERVHEQERVFIRHLAQRLGVQPSVADMALCEQAGLD